MRPRLFPSRPTAPAPASTAAGQRVRGPYRGYYVVAFAYPVNDKFAGRAGICSERPAEPGARMRVLEWISSVGAYNSAEKAMQAAEYQARCVIDGLAPNWAPFTAPG